MRAIGSKILNECGSVSAKALQDKLNGDAKKNDKEGGRKAQEEKHYHHKLDLNNPIEEGEQRDIDQIEGRLDGNLVHYLSNGEYVISYAGIMKLAETHGIIFYKHYVKQRKDGNGEVIAYARMGNSTRASGKPLNGNFVTAIELAKRNAARQLLPYAEIKALEHKAQLSAEFSWEVAYNKCVEAAGTKANVDITIHELVKEGKLRQDNPSHYNRTEWLVIYSACKRDASNDGSPSSWEKLMECRRAAKSEARFDWIRSSLADEGVIPKRQLDWQDEHYAIVKQACALDKSLFNREMGHWKLIIEPNSGVFAYERRYRFWLIDRKKKQLRYRCFWCGRVKSRAPQLYDELIYWERYEIKTVVCADCVKSTKDEDLTKQFDELYKAKPNAVKTEGLPKTAFEFIKAFSEAIDQVRKEGGARNESLCRMDRP